MSAPEVTESDCRSCDCGLKLRHSNSSVNENCYISNGSMQLQATGIKRPNLSNRRRDCKTVSGTALRTRASRCRLDCRTEVLTHRRCYITEYLPATTDVRCNWPSQSFMATIAVILLSSSVALAGGLEYKGSENNGCSAVKQALGKQIEVSPKMVTGQFQIKLLD